MSYVFKKLAKLNRRTILYLNAAMNEQNDLWPNKEIEEHVRTILRKDITRIVQNELNILPKKVVRGMILYILNWLIDLVTK